MKWNNTILFSLIVSILSIILVANVSAFSLEKHLVQLEVDSNYPCHIENGDTIVCPALEKKQIDDWQVAITDLKPEEKDLGKLKDTDKVNYLKEAITLYSGKTDKTIAINKEYREKIDVNSLGDDTIKIGFNTNVFGVSGTPLENFDVNTITGMVRYRPLNMTWLSFTSTGNTVTLPNIATGSTDKNISYSFWINLSETSGSFRSIVGAGSTAGGIWTSNGLIYLSFQNVSNANYNISYPIINDSLWHYFVGTISPLNLTMYLDGTLVNQSSALLGGMISSTGLNKLGYSSYTPTMSIDEFRRFNITLTQTQITSFYNAGRVRNDTILTGQRVYFPLNTFQGSLAYDLSGNALNGTITGATWQSDNINVTTLGYQVNISIVNITNALIYWDNGTVINKSFNGNKTLSYFNTQTIWIREGFCQESTYYFNETTLTCKLVKTSGDLVCIKINEVYSLSIVFLGLIILCSMIFIVVRITQGHPFDEFIQRLFYIILISVIPLSLGIIILQAMFVGC